MNTSKRIIASNKPIANIISGISAAPIKAVRRNPTITPTTRLKTMAKAVTILLVQLIARQLSQVVFAHLESNIFLHPFKINRG